MLWPGKRQSAAFNPSTTIIIYITTIITTIITSIITSIIIYITSNITTVITIITTTITTIIIYIASSIITVITIITNIIIMIMIFGLGIWFTDKFFLYWWFFAVLHHHHDHHLEVIFARTVIMIFIMIYFRKVRKIWTDIERLPEEWRQERNQSSVEWEILFLWMSTNPRNVDA